MAAFKLSTRPLIAGTLAAALAMTPLAATPARADGEGALAAGALALFMFGLVAGSAASASQSAPAPVANPPRWPNHQPNTYRPVPPQQPARVDNRKELPRECRVTYRFGSSSATYYDKSCLQQEMRGWRALPDNCEQTIRIVGSGDGRQKAYPESCLARYGYTREARR